MPRPSQTMGQTIHLSLTRNGNIFTGIVASLVFFVGIMIVNNPSRWWVAAVAVLGVGLLVFLFVNGKSVIKGIIAFLALSVSGDYGYRLGTIADPQGTAGGLWLMSLFGLWLLALAVTYARPALTSRWFSLMVLPAIHFALVSTGGIFWDNIRLALLVGFPVSFLFFLLMYYLPTIIRTNRRFPKPEVAAFDENLAESIRNQGWGAWVRNTRGLNTMVVWNDEVAYQLVAIPLQNSFEEHSRRFPKRVKELVYKNRPIASTLHRLTQKMTPLTGVAGADILPVIVDTQNGNGNSCKVVGIPIPDSTKKTPVAIIPGKGTLNSKKPLVLLNKLKNIDDFAAQLTPKQLIALDTHLPVDTMAEDTENFDNGTIVEVKENPAND